MVHSAAPECQYQNQVERSLQTVGNGVTKLLCDQSLLDNSFWGLTLKYYLATMNATPNSLEPDTSPQFVVTGRYPDLRNQFIFPFGQPVVVVELKQERDSFRFSVPGELGVACDPSCNGASNRGG